MSENSSRPPEEGPSSDAADASASPPNAAPPPVGIALGTRGLPYAFGGIAGPGALLGTPGVAMLPIALQQVTQQSWQAPFPPPDAAERFEAICPGAFDRILSMAERNQQAQIEAARNAQRLTQRDTRRGHWLGFAASLAAMAGAGVCAWLGQPWVAVAFLSVPVMSVARALVEGGRQPEITVASPEPAPSPQPQKAPPARPSGDA